MNTNRWIISLILLLGFIFFVSQLRAQETQILGKITDAKTGEPLIGVNITVKDRLWGTGSNMQGEFSLSVKANPPLILVVSSVGYITQEIKINETPSNLNIQLIEQQILGKEIVIAASRVEENILESPVSIEKLDLRQIQAIPAANFYDGLGRIKGVDMSVQSLTFANPNTRGFNGNTNYRMNQVIDGVENIVPGLSFAPGNIVGISQLDLESVELLVGASSALYGPGGLNGTLIMNSKNPFEYQGLSASLQTGLMHLGANYRQNPQGMYDFAVRYAKSFNNRVAFKLNASYLSALDWHASDTRDRTNLTGSQNHYASPGYDGVNMYGDEAVGQVDLGKIAPIAGVGYAQNQGLIEGTPEFEQAVNFIISKFPQSQILTRTGYREVDFANYNTYSLKLNGSLHYRVNDRLEASVQGNFGRGTSLYTANNRFALVNFQFYTTKFELKSKDFFIRFWTTAEDAGDSFDMGGLALRFNEKWKPSDIWYEDFIESFTTLRILGQDLTVAYPTARYTADNRNENGQRIDPDNRVSRPLPGEARFDSIYNVLRTTPVNQGGAKIVDKTRMYHVEGMYNFSKFIKFAEVIAGISHRIYRINSEGTVFGDLPGNPIIVNQFGAYLQIVKKMWNEKLKITGSARYDRNENFDGRITPRVSLVYGLDKERNHFLRGSLQTAFRFPATADQFTDLDVGVYRVLGGLPQFRQRYNLNEASVYPLDNPNPVVGRADFSKGTYKFPTMRPERVIAYEIGYKGLWNKFLLLDAYIYFNTYNGFLATQGLVQNPNPDGSGGNKYTMTVSTDQPINAWGWAISGDYKFVKGYTIGANVAYNTLAYNELPSGFQTNFNSPNYRSNLSFGNREVFKNWGFSINWRWQNRFVWESTFGVGEVPAYHTLDAQISYRMTKLKTIFKMGGSNLLNRYYTTGFGNPQIGGLYYLSLNFDEWARW
ncbi:MAG: TonB-dependent receptor [Microscillaceae bacterium]|jgi:outer membrane receptor protein involved in Fe transport|nr:TonB-dependent receptor [Microscillaceae bacterium]